MTPQEMADWLLEHGGPPSAAHVDAARLSREWAEIVCYLRRQPTDAQKMEEAPIDKMEIRANAARLEAHAGAGADEE